MSLEKYMLRAWEREDQTNPEYETCRDGSGVTCPEVLFLPEDEDHLSEVAEQGLRDMELTSGALSWSFKTVLCPL